MSSLQVLCRPWAKCHLSGMLGGDRWAMSTQFSDGPGRPGRCTFADETLCTSTHDECAFVHMYSNLIQLNISGAVVYVGTCEYPDDLAWTRSHQCLSNPYLLKLRPKWINHRNQQA